MTFLGYVFLGGLLGCYLLTGTMLRFAFKTSVLFFVATMLLVIEMGFEEGDLTSFNQMLEKDNIVSILFWTVCLFSLASWAFLVNTRMQRAYTYIFLLSFSMTLFLYYIDDMATRDSFFFELRDTGNAGCLVMFTGVFFCFFSLINLIDEKIVKRLFKKRTQLTG